MRYQIDSNDLLNRFLSYVQIDTQADSRSATTPSSPKQWALIQQLESELRALPLKDVRVTEFGYVLATVPATSSKAKIPTVALLAHVDTAEGCSGLAKPMVHRNYQGQTIVLPDDPAQTLNPKDLPLLKEKIGEDLITASGKSLLGADDKSGVAIVMAAVRHLVLHPEIPHGPVRVCFNPDEEIGRGTEKLTLVDLAADVAYTLDAEHRGEVDFESFSADRATVTIDGIAAHPGWANGVMVNALRLAADFIAALPRDVSPERTCDRAGFIHPTDMRGTPESVEITMILRDFELDGLEQKGRIVRDCAAKIQAAEPRAKVRCEITKQYRNMRYWLEKDMRPVEFAIEAVKRAGMTPMSEAIRGGTDGSRLTERGLPTPNVFTGFHQVHSEREWVSLQDMTLAAETLIHLLKIWEERA